MPLILHIGGNAPGEVAGRRIEVASRLSIGRGAENDLVLPDPERTLSKTHCTITLAAGGYAVTDTSTNGVFLNNAAERLPRGVPVPLGEGNVLRLGQYELKVSAVVVPGAGVGQGFGAGSAPMSAPPPAAPTHDVLDDPFGDDPFGAPSAMPMPTPAPHYPATPQNFAATPSHDDDFFGGPVGSTPLGAPAYGGQGHASQGGGSQGGGNILPDDVDLFGDNKKAEVWHGASEADHAPSNQAFFAPPKASVEAIPDDWDLSDLGIELGKSAAAPRQPAAPPTAAPPLPASRAPAAPPPAGGDTASLAPLLAALGLSGMTLSDAEKANLMRLAGEALKTTVEGLTEILAARANTKQEFRIERTMIGATGNNPLKFSATLDEAMRVMLVGRVPGFLSAPQAIREALDDVKSHQLAVLAGMQTALATVITRFDPAKLEQRIEQSSLIDGILPGARKARYWELFRALYKEIAGELQDDFQKVFGAEFARAYKDQIEKL